MAVRANPALVDELERYGAEHVSRCFQCGNCTASCHHADDELVFPRRSMRLVQMGLESRLRGGLEPWLCYYCGDCSEQCPREADPGETMMSLRRWLTAQYDFTGLSRLLYRSWKAELVALLTEALITGIGFVTFGFLRGGGDLSVYSGPGAFLPSSAVHVFDWIMAGTLFSILAVNCARMWSFTMRGPNAPPVTPGLYLKHLFLLPRHFLVQPSFRECEDKKPWALHLVLMASYVTLLVLIMFFLHEMQAGPDIRWSVHALGYAASIGLIGTSVLALRGRLRRTLPHQRRSHESDWLFLGLLVFVAGTGVIQHLLHRAGLPVAANLAYVVHLMGVVPMLVLEVPFGKWSHMAYRPLAKYLAAVQAEAQANQAAAAAKRPQAA
jgi:hypothetical protein